MDNQTTDHAQQLAARRGTLTADEELELIRAETAAVYQAAGEEFLKREKEKQ